MSDPSTTQGPYTPPTLLDYAGRHGEQPIPLTREYAHLLNQASEFTSGARMLKGSGMWDVALGLFFMGMGAMVLMTASRLPARGGALAATAIVAIAALMLITGGVLAGIGIWLVAAPSPAGMLADGVTLILLALINGGLFARELLHGESPHWIWPLLFLLMFCGGIARFVRYRRFKEAARSAPPPATMKWLNELRRSLRKKERGTGAISFEFASTNAFPPVICRGRLTPELAMCLINRERVVFHTPADLHVDPFRKGGEEFIPPADARKKVKAVVTMGTKSFSAMMPYESLARVEAWSAAET